MPYDVYIQILWAVSARHVPVDAKEQLEYIDKEYKRLQYYSTMSTTFCLINWLVEIDWLFGCAFWPIDTYTTTYSEYFP